MVHEDVVADARAWLTDDPDPRTRLMVEQWLRDGDREALLEAFGARLRFGTAGIRGPLGPGPNRMNRRLVRQVAAGIADHVGTGSVVVGRDARHGSPALAADAAAVLAGSGVRVLVLPDPVPTPVLAFAVRHLRCDAGVMITASHNPPGDNGVKVFGADGAQIVAPADASIAAAIERVTSVLALPLGQPTTVEDDVLDAYLDAAASRVPPGPRDVTIVHTALHGVGSVPLQRLLARAGFPPVHTVAAQAEPDPDFPTVAYPNPEEPGAMDLALADASRVGADLVLANDPDADRLAVAIPDGARWRMLTGDEVGALLAEQALASTSGGDRLVVNTVVSSTLLGKLAAEAGAQWASTLTGFKWVIRAADERPGTRFVFGYEEALGYAVHDLVRDKDGLTAAAAVAALVADLKARGETIDDRLEAMARRHGLHATRQWSVRLDGLAGARRITDAVAAVIADPPRSLAGHDVLGIDRPAADVLVLRLDADNRVIIRPSGTEPKLKTYLQVVLSPVTDWKAAKAEAAARLDALQAAVTAYLDLG